MFNRNKNKKVFAAMSGGVDSSVAALLLQQQGYDVTGVYMRNWHAYVHDGFVGDCGWKQDQADAQRVCEQLGIPFLMWDFSKEYYKNVIEDFFSEYAAGRTPNPDVLCNKYIKFGKFLDTALEHGADYVATGHHVRRRRRQKFSIFNFSRQGGIPQTSEYNNQGAGQFSKNVKRKNLKSDYKRQTGGYELLEGVDQHKDQSYFLWTLTQEQLARSLFPIGEYYKTYVRKIAKEAGLSTASKPDSQGICFVGNINVREFIRSRLPERAGKVITVDGDVVGTHNGVQFYTEGQRQGIGIGGTKEPYYVVAKDHQQNTLIVAEGYCHPRLYSSELSALRFHWIAEHAPPLPVRCKARIRYRQNPAQKCTVFFNDNQDIRIHFNKPQRAVSPGQSIVFYNKRKCLGGCIIA